MAAGEETRLVYFAPEFTETSTIKRAREFIDMGMSPVVLGFERGRYNRYHRPEWPHHLLGRTRDAHYVNRLLALLIALPVLVRIRGTLRSAHVFYARNIDQLILSLLCRTLFNRGAGVAYEILDIQPIFTGRGFASRVLRWLERRCLRFVDLLVVSSPAFHRNYYLPVQGFHGPWFLLENKLREYGTSQTRKEPMSIASPLAGGSRRPWVIGYFGLIRGQATLDLIARVASRLRGTVEFQFRGVLTTINDGRFQAALDGNSNILYGGEYANPADLGKIYESVDFAWALDLENIQANSRWLLPCRFYEAGAFGVPCLAAAGFEIGRRIEELGVGWTFNEPFEESIVAFFSGLSDREYESKCARLRDTPRATFVVGAEERSLAREIDELLRRRSLRRASAPSAFLKNVRGPGVAADAGVLEKRL